MCPPRRTPEGRSTAETLPTNEIKRYDRAVNKEVQRNLYTSKSEFQRRMNEAIVRATSKLVDENPGAKTLKQFDKDKYNRTKLFLAKKLKGKFRIQDLPSLRISAALNVGKLARKEAKVNLSLDTDLSTTFLKPGASKREQTRAMISPSLNLISKLSKQGVPPQQLKKIVSQRRQIAKNARTKAVLDANFGRIITLAQKYMTDALNNA